MSDLFVDDRVKDGFNYLIKWVAYSPRSEKECINRLYEKQFHKNEVEWIVELAKNDSIINDNLYTELFIESYKNKYGKKRIEDKLVFEKGVEKSLVNNKIAELITDEFEDQLTLMFAKKYINQKHIDLNTQSDKLVSYLLGKGFNWSNINYVKKMIRFELEDYGD